MHDARVLLLLFFSIAFTAIDSTAQPTPIADPPVAAAPSNDDGGYDEGFRLTRDTSPFSVTLNGLVQTRYTWLEPNGDSNIHTFDVPLARLALGGAAFDDQVTYFFQLEASTFGDSNRLTLLDGWLQYRTGRSISIKAGRILLPFSRQFLTHPGELLFADLSRADYAFNLPRSIGTAVGVSLRRVRVDAAITNSVRALDATGQQNRDGSLAAMARAEMTLISGSGYLESSPTPLVDRQLSLGIAGAYNPVAEASVFQNVAPGDRTTSVTVDGNYRDRRLTLAAAFYHRRNDTGGPRLDDRGAYLQGGLYVVPAEWEIAARTSVVDFDRTRLDGVASDVREYEIGLNRYLHGHHVKLQADAGVGRHRDRAPGARDDRRVRVQFQLLF